MIAIMIVIPVALRTIKEVNSGNKRNIIPTSIDWTRRNFLESDEALPGEYFICKAKYRSSVNSGPSHRKDERKRD